ncbi:hypothetical protein CC85DRAFT_283508 [Cutaneotrichosporon oleaginosum]|uniref:Uncharacterized protein n=1 Tax=Cutaneotrichosporon oleaginosum TaxID=879819 RepID=A0A0J0XU08_9TREE|nr:uncharacterized protein CC85DRAFT_283508 [Cutaneotrichosporon oleaginosum]KLT44573.1 hypothetical protein CC85DRAFT_283508 [Cutaneotrichosporon oleaginosum]TXT13913.1 hypothetical protein COLE_00106 [Cutaneotrichosporon oleaginosum]
MFPHILDRIICLAPHASLLALRGVSRALRERVDAQLAEHLVLRSPKSHRYDGVYIHTRGQPSRPHAPVGTDIALPGFAFYPGNVRHTYSAAVEERESRHLRTRRGPRSLAARLLCAAEGAAEEAGRSAHAAGAVEWCHAALVHTHTLDLVGFRIENALWLVDMQKHMPNLKVVRVARSVGFHLTGLSVPDSQHLILSVDTWDSQKHLPVHVTNSIHTATIFVNVHAGRYYHCPEPAVNSIHFRRGQDTTVVFRAIRADQTPYDPGEVCSVLSWRHGLVGMGDGGRVTFVNVSEETHRALGIVPSDEDVPDKYHSAFMRMLETSQAGRLQRSSVDVADIVRSCVRLLGMDEWMAEASEHDREACLSFW